MERQRNGHGSDQPEGPHMPETLLVVELPDLPRADARLDGAVQHHVRFADIDPGLIARLRPDRVICPLLARGFDACLLAQRLEATGFRGRLTVIAPRLPDSAMVQREVSSAAPTLTVEVVVP